LANRTGPRPTVGEVAQSCGFASDSHFSRAFRKAFGYPPGAQRESDVSGGA
jgi:AraC-like DNA-binding protein